VKVLTPSRVGANLRWGIGWGIGLAAIYSVIALPLGLLRGCGLRIGGESFSTGRIILIYFGGGILGGLTLGLLRPLTRTKPGAAIVGALVAFPLSYMMVLFLDKSAGRELLTASLLALILGPLFGLKSWEPPEDHSS
jgi:hypothetical protein